MFKQLTPQVYFGDRTSPFETLDKVQCVINVAHHLRPEYFAALKLLPYTTLYLRLAKKDREDVDLKYLLALRYFVGYARDTNKLPLLTHCRMGGHRGPSSAIAAAFFLSDMTPATLEKIHSDTLLLVPGLIRGRNYYKSTMELLRNMAKEIVEC